MMIDYAKASRVALALIQDCATCDEARLVLAVHGYRPWAFSQNIFTLDGNIAVVGLSPREVEQNRVTYHVTNGSTTSADLRDIKSILETWDD